MLGRLGRLRFTAARVWAAGRTRAFGDLQQLPPLAVKVQSEIDEELNAYAPDPSIEPFLKESDFKLVEDEQSPLIKLRKVTDDVTVEVNFEAKAHVPNDQTEDGQVNPENMNYVDFQVIVKRKGREGGLLFDCLSFNGELQIVKVSYADNITALQELTHTFEEGYYRGPDFLNLKEKVQKTLLDYITHLGVDEDLVAFLECYSTDKEQRLYMHWLKEAKTLLVNPSK